MVDVDPDDLMRRVAEDEAYIDPSLKKRDELIETYASSFHLGKSGKADEPENHPFEFTSLFLPLLAYTNPRVRLGTASRSRQKPAVQALNHAINRWVTQTGFVRLAEKLAMDYFFGWGATVASVGPRPGMWENDQPDWWPMLYRVSPRQFGFDHTAYSFEQAEHVWWSSAADHAEMVEMARMDAERAEKDREGWIADRVREMSPGGGMDRIKAEKQEDADLRNQVLYYNVWVPGARVKEENTPEKGYSGAIFTFAWSTGDAGIEIREPYDYRGHPDGPATLWGCYTVPDEALPLSPLIPTAQLQKDLNRVARANTAASLSWKRTLVTEDDQLANDIKYGVHDGIAVAESVNKDNLHVYESGGLSDQGLAQEGRLRDQLDRNSGIFDAMRGNVTGDATATENMIAGSAASNRQGFIIKKFVDAASAALERPLAHMYWEDRIIYDLGPEIAAQQGAQPGQTAYFYGGKAEENGPFEELELTVMPQSMGRRSPQQDKEEAMGLLALMGQLSELVQLNPFADVGRVAELIAEPMGYPDLPDLANWDLAQQLTLMQILGDQEAPQQMTKPKPQLTRTVAAVRQPERGQSTIGKARSNAQNNRQRLQRQGATT